jgi:hypothetical protein
MKGRLVGKATVVTEPLFAGSDPSLIEPTVAQWYAEWSRLSLKVPHARVHRDMLLAFATTLVSGLKMVDEIFFNLEQGDEEDLLFWLTRAILKIPELFPTQRSPSTSVTEGLHIKAENVLPIRA